MLGRIYFTKQKVECNLKACCISEAQNEASGSLSVSHLKSLITLSNSGGQKNKNRCESDLASASFSPGSWFKEFD